MEKRVRFSYPAQKQATPPINVFEKIIGLSDRIYRYMAISEVESGQMDQERRITEKDSAVLGLVLPRLENEFNDRQPIWPVKTSLISDCLRRVVYIGPSEKDQFIYNVAEFNRSRSLPVIPVKRGGRAVYLVADLERVEAVFAAEVILLEVIRMEKVDRTAVLLRTQRALEDLGRTETAKIIQDGLKRVSTTRSRKRILGSVKQETITPEEESLISAWETNRIRTVLNWQGRKKFSLEKT